MRTFWSLLARKKFKKFWSHTNIYTYCLRYAPTYFYNHLLVGGQLTVIYHCMYFCVQNYTARNSRNLHVKIAKLNMKTADTSLKLQKRFVLRCIQIRTA